jgi:hypothetical protein
VSLLLLNCAAGSSMSLMLCSFLSRIEPNHHSSEYFPNSVTNSSIVKFCCHKKHAVNLRQHNIRPTRHGVRSCGLVAAGSRTNEVPCSTWRSVGLLQVCFCGEKLACVLCLRIRSHAITHTAASWNQHQLTSQRLCGANTTWSGEHCMR